MDKKIELFKKLLKEKEIDIERNHYLSIEQSKENSVIYTFGENKVAICNEQENNEFVAKTVLSKIHEYSFSFQSFADILNIKLSEVEDFFVGYILSDELWIKKEQNDGYYVDVEGVEKFIEGKLTIEEFIKKMVAFFNKDEDLVKFINDYDYKVVDGFYVYDMTNIEEFMFPDEVRI